MNIRYFQIESKVRVADKESFNYGKTGIVTSIMMAIHKKNEKITVRLDATGKEYNFFADALELCTPIETYKVKIMQAAYGYITVEAVSISDAIDKAEKIIEESIETIQWDYGETKPVYADILDNFKQ